MKRNKGLVALMVLFMVMTVGTASVFASSAIVRKQTKTSKVGVNGAIVQCTVTYYYKNTTALKKGSPYNVTASKAKKANTTKLAVYQYVNQSTTLKKSGTGYKVIANGLWLTSGEPKGVAVTHVITGYKAPKK